KDGFDGNPAAHLDLCSVLSGHIPESHLLQHSAGSSDHSQCGHPCTGRIPMTYLTRFLTGTAISLALALPAAAAEYRIAVGDGAGGTQEALGKAFIAALEKESGGEMTGKLFLNGQLGDEQDTVTAAATGTLDFSILAINNITPFSPSVGALTLPYVILSLEDAEKITQGEIGQQMIDRKSVV